VTTRAPRSHVRFALPASLGPDTKSRAVQLQAHLSQALGRDTEVTVAGSYEQLARELLSGKVDAAWAPPFVCARIEAMGVRVLVRGVRNGASVYRAALVTKQNSNVTLDTLKGTTAVWSDRDSVGGYLLPMAWLRDKGLDPARTFHQQDFAGNYRAALEAVFNGKADVTSVFAPAGPGDETGIGEVWPEQKAGFKVLGFTDEAPNDGVAVAMGVQAAVVSDIEKTLLSLGGTDVGQSILKDCFHAEKFELAPRMGYRALYRVALASL